VLSPAVNPAWQLSWQDGSTGKSFFITEPGTYSLSATNNCGSFTDEIIITKGACKLAVPNAFTPNHDGHNEIFRILGVETVTSFHLQIFNRWGQMVFETNDKSKAWDGSYKGLEAPSGTFLYILKYATTDEPQTQIVKGTIVLIR
jgi:gliding motility-associated-like protein